MSDPPSVARAKTFQDQWRKAQIKADHANHEFAMIRTRFKQFVIEAAEDHPQLLLTTEGAWLFHHLHNTCGWDYEKIGELVGLTRNEMLKAVR